MDQQKNFVQEKLILADYVHVLSISFAANYTRSQKEQAILDQKISLLIEDKTNTFIPLDTERTTLALI